jgi:hypothetical protein
MVLKFAVMFVRLDAHLDILEPGPCSRAKPHRAVREISDELQAVLRTRLLKERDMIFDEKPGSGVARKSVYMRQ